MNPAAIPKLAAAGNMTVDEFRDKFGYMSGHAPA